MSALIDGYIFHLVARQGLAAEVPTLVTGEFGWDTDKKTLRVGDDTSSPPRVMSTKSTGDFDFSTVGTITLAGNLTFSQGKINGMDLSGLNQANGILVRRGNGVFASKALVSGDNSIQVTGGTGLSDNIDIRLSPVSAVLTSDGQLPPMPYAGFKGATAAGATTSLTTAQAASILPVFTQSARGMVPAIGSAPSGKVLTDSGWSSPINVDAFDWKSSVRLASTTSINTSGSPVPIMGVTLIDGNHRIALVGQGSGLGTAHVANGIYDVTVSAGGTAWAWARSQDANSSAEVTSGMSFFTSEGTNGGALYTLTTADPITLDTTALTFVQTGGGGQYLPLTGGTLSGDMGISKASANNRLFHIYTSNVDRWRWGGNNTTESGANAGTNFVIDRHADDGSLIAHSLTIDRPTGAWHIELPGLRQIAQDIGNDATAMGYLLGGAGTMRSSTVLSGQGTQTMYLDLGDIGTNVDLTFWGYFALYTPPGPWAMDGGAVAISFDNGTSYTFTLAANDPGEPAGIFAGRWGSTGYCQYANFHLKAFSSGGIVYYQWGLTAPTGGANSGAMGYSMGKYSGTLSHIKIRMTTVYSYNLWDSSSTVLMRLN